MCECVVCVCVLCVVCVCVCVCVCECVGESDKQGGGGERIRIVRMHPLQRTHSIHQAGERIRIVLRISEFLPERDKKKRAHILTHTHTHTHTHSHSHYDARTHARTHTRKRADLLKELYNCTKRALKLPLKRHTKGQSFAAARNTFSVFYNTKRLQLK